VDEAVFQQAQEILQSKYHVPYQIVNGARNPLAGLVICKVCGAKMVLRPYGKKDSHIVCRNKCGNKSSKFIYIEERMLQSFNDWLKNYELNIKVDKKKNTNIEVYQSQLDNLEKELKELQSQKLRLHDFLERGIYDIDTFIERSQNIADRIDATDQSLLIIKGKIESEAKHAEKADIVPFIRKVLELYSKAKDISQKNMLLKTIIEKMEYKKEKDQRDDNFTLVIFPKVLE
jgi:hypothetical protein